MGVSADIADMLKTTKEQQTVVGPLVQHLVDVGWSLNQIVFGNAEWRIPKTPSDHAKRESKKSFDGFPVDIAVFDEEKNIRSCQLPTTKVVGLQLPDVAPTSSGGRPPIVPSNTEVSEKGVALRAH